MLFSAARGLFPIDENLVHGWRTSRPIASPSLTACSKKLASTATFSTTPSRGTSEPPSPPSARSSGRQGREGRGAAGVAHVQGRRHLDAAAETARPKKIASATTPSTTSPRGSSRPPSARGLGHAAASKPHGRLPPASQDTPALPPAPKPATPPAAAATQATHTTCIPPIPTSTSHPTYAEVARRTIGVPRQPQCPPTPPPHPTTLSRHAHAPPPAPPTPTPSIIAHNPTFDTSESPPCRLGVGLPSHPSSAPLPLPTHSSARAQASPSRNPPSATDILTHALGDPHAATQHVPPPRLDEMPPAEVLAYFLHAHTASVVALHTPRRRPIPMPPTADLTTLLRAPAAGGRCCAPPPPPLPHPPPTPFDSATGQPSQPPMWSPPPTDLPSPPPTFLRTPSHPSAHAAVASHNGSRGKGGWSGWSAAVAIAGIYLMQEGDTQDRLAAGKALYRAALHLSPAAVEAEAAPMEVEEEADALLRPTAPPSGARSPRRRPTPTRRTPSRLRAPTPVANRARRPIVSVPLSRPNRLAAFFLALTPAAAAPAAAPLPATTSLLSSSLFLMLLVLAAVAAAAATLAPPALSTLHRAVFRRRSPAVSPAIDDADDVERHRLLGTQGRPDTDTPSSRTTPPPSPPSLQPGIDSRKTVRTPPPRNLDLHRLACQLALCSSTSRGTIPEPPTPLDIFFSHLVAEANAHALQFLFANWLRSHQKSTEREIEFQIEMVTSSFPTTSHVDIRTAIDCMQRLAATRYASAADRFIRAYERESHDAASRLERLFDELSEPCATCHDGSALQLKLLNTLDSTSLGAGLFDAWRVAPTYMFILTLMLSDTADGDYARLDRMGEQTLQEHLSLFRDGPNGKFTVDGCHGRRRTVASDDGPRINRVIRWRSFHVPTARGLLMRGSVDTVVVLRAFRSLSRSTLAAQGHLAMPNHGFADLSPHSVHRHTRHNLLSIITRIFFPRRPSTSFMPRDLTAANLLDYFGMEPVDGRLAPFHINDVGHTSVGYTWLVWDLYRDCPPGPWPHQTPPDNTRRWERRRALDVAVERRGLDDYDTFRGYAHDDDEADHRTFSGVKRSHRSLHLRPPLIRAGGEWPEPPVDYGNPPAPPRHFHHPPSLFDLAAAAICHDGALRDVPDTVRERARDASRSVWTALLHDRLLDASRESLVSLHAPLVEHELVCVAEYFATLISHPFDPTVPPPPPSHEPPAPTPRPSDTKAVVRRSPSGESYVESVAIAAQVSLRPYRRRVVRSTSPDLDHGLIERLGDEWNLHVSDRQLLVERLRDQWRLSSYVAQLRDVQRAPPSSPFPSPPPSPPAATDGAAGPDGTSASSSTGGPSAPPPFATPLDVDAVIRALADSALDTALCAAEAGGRAAGRVEALTDASDPDIYSAHPVAIAFSAVYSELPRVPPGVISFAAQQGVDLPLLLTLAVVARHVPIVLPTIATRLRISEATLRAVADAALTFYRRRAASGGQSVPHVIRALSIYYGFDIHITPLDHEHPFAEDPDARPATAADSATTAAAAAAAAVAIASTPSAIASQSIWGPFAAPPVPDPATNAVFAASISAAADSHSAVAYLASVISAAADRSAAAAADLALTPTPTAPPPASPPPFPPPPSPPSSPPPGSDDASSSGAGGDPPDRASPTAPPSTSAATDTEPSAVTPTATPPLSFIGSFLSSALRGVRAFGSSRPSTPSPTPAASPAVADPAPAPSPTPHPAPTAPDAVSTHDESATVGNPVVPLGNLSPNITLSSTATDTSNTHTSDAMSVTSVTQTGSDHGEVPHTHPLPPHPRPHPPVPLFVPHQQPHPNQPHPQRFPYYQHPHPHNPHHPHHLHNPLHPHNPLLPPPFYAPPFSHFPHHPPHHLPPHPQHSSHFAAPPLGAPYSEYGSPYHHPSGAPPPHPSFAPPQPNQPFHSQSPAWPSPPSGSTPPAPPYGPGNPPPPPPRFPPNSLDPRAPAFSPAAFRAPTSAPTADGPAGTHPSSASATANAAANAAAAAATLAASSLPPADVPPVDASRSPSALDDFLIASLAPPAAAPSAEPPPSAKALGKRPRNGAEDTPATSLRRVAPMFAPSPACGPVAPLGSSSSAPSRSPTTGGGSHPDPAHAVLRGAPGSSSSIPPAAPPASSSAAPAFPIDLASSGTASAASTPSPLDRIPLASPTSGTPGAALASMRSASLTNLIDAAAGPSASPVVPPPSPASSAAAPDQPGLVIQAPPRHQRILPSRPADQHIGRRLGWCAVPHGPNGNPIITSQSGAFAEHCQGKGNNNFGSVFYSAQGGYDSAVAHILAHFANTERSAPPPTLCFNCFLHHLPTECASPRYDWTSLVGRNHPSCSRCGQVHHIGQRCPSFPPPPPPVD